MVNAGQWRRAGTLLCLALAVVCLLHAAEPVSNESDYVRTDFTIEQGLPDNTVNALLQTENGLLWVGTESGLASFDGHTFAPVGLRIPGAAPAGAVNALLEGAEGDLWVGTDAGIVRIPKADLNDAYQTNSTAFRLGDEQSDEIETLFRARDGVVWAGTNHGLYSFDGKKFVSALHALYVSRIHQKLDGKLMLITGGGFVEFDGHHAIPHPGLGAQFGVTDSQIFDVLQDSSGTLWYCTNKGVFPAGSRNAPHLTDSQARITATFRAYADARGVLWFNTGIGLYRLRGNMLQSPAPGLEAHAVSVGKDGDIWIGTNGSGLTHLQPRRVRVYTQADGLQNDTSMTVLAAHDGRLWVGNNCGLAVYDGKAFHTFKEKDGLANSCVWSLAEDKEDNLWIGTYGGGIFRFRDGVFTQYTMEQGLPSRIVFAMAFARDGTLWVGTPDGLAHMQNGRIRSYTTANGLSSNRILDIHEDHAGTIWVATQGGVDRYAGDRFVPLKPSRASEEVLPRRFAEDSQGNLYTTDAPHGISRIQGDEIALLDNSLNLMDMVETPDHSLWFSSRDGVVRIAESELARAGSTGHPLNFEQLDRADGMLSTQAGVGSPNIALDADGKLWVGTVKGLAMIDTRHLSIASRKPNIFVAGVWTDGVRDRVGAALQLAPGMHHVELHMDAVDLAALRKIRLQYRLEGVDSNWLNADATRTAVYTNLPVGTHRLLVRATDNVGDWNEGSVVYEVTQEPYFYQTRLFQVSAGVALLLLLVAAYIFRVRHLMHQTKTILEERQVERESVARDLHDTFLQGVQGLILRFHTGTQQLPEDQPVRPLFEEALRQSDQVMLEGRNVLSRLRTRKAMPETLADAFNALGRELHSLSAAQFCVIVSGRSRALSAMVQEEIFKVGREALFNAFRHAAAGHIEAELHFGLQELRVRFRDDGVGIDAAVVREGSVPGHYGLPGMRERVTRIGGSIALWSRVGAGTEIEVRIPGAIAFLVPDESRQTGWIRRLLSARPS
jgi:ligand-binding sensor domain-containing protein/signal transduction histidine kinase